MRKHKFLCDKIIRDNDPALLVEKGIEIETEKLSEKQILIYLKKKIVEEALEVQEADSVDQILNELVDVLEAAEALKKSLNVSSEDFQGLYERKRAHKGGFEKGILLKAITLDEENPKFQHYASRPQKYPEVPV